MRRVEHPGLYAACLEIALDNGGINRMRSVERQRQGYVRWLATQPDEIIRPLDEWLSSLTKDRLILVCAGGEDEPETIAAKEGAPAFLDDVLNSYFDEVC